MTERVEIGNAVLYHGDCREVLPGMPDNSVDAIVTDPPYFRVKADYWDREWDSDKNFLAFIGALCEQWQRILKPNGSLYVFASPHMAARVEMQIRQRFAVLNHITWRKGKPGLSSVSLGNRSEKESMRAWWPESERILFAEHYGADNIAKGEAGYEAKCDELRGFVFEPLRAYLAEEWKRAGLTKRDAEEATGTQMAGHWFTKSQWALPTAQHYATLQDRANKSGQFEYLRREYEDLRRPFTVTPRDQWSDVWDFDPVSAYPGKHPCEKPIALMSQIIRASTKPGAVVLDCFMGSAATGRAALPLGRQFIGIERDPQHFGDCVQRLSAMESQSALIPIEPLSAHDTVGRAYAQESLL